jgi:HEAT repeat protein
LTRARGAAVFAAVCAAASVAWAVDPELRKLARHAESYRRAEAARALAKDGSPEAVKVLAELIADRVPSVRDAAVLGCDAVSDEDSVKALAAVARAKDELTRRNAAESLGRTKSAAALPTLELLATKDPSAAVRADALDALWPFTGQAKAMSIARAASADRDASVRAAAVEAAGRIGGEGAVELVTKALTDADDGVRCVAMTSRARVARAAAVAGFAAAATDASWRVRAQCVDDALALREAPAVDALVALIGDKNTRVAASAHRALQKLSGRETGRDPELWAAWWIENRSSWKPPQGELDRDAADDPKRTTARYHGLEVATDAAVFVADLSGSMKHPLSEGETRTRWEVAADELRRTFAALPDSFVADVVLFGGAVRSALDRPQALARPVREKTETFLAAAAPRGGGDLLGGVLAALARDEIDTVFLLSDGAPTLGDFVDRGRVRAAIRQRNRTRKCVIESIGFGAARTAERAFLEGVARDSGGRAVFRGETGR